MLALLLVSVDMRVADLHQWAREALVEERRVQELGDDWKPLDASSSWSMKGKAGAMLQPMERALQLRTPATLENVTKAMQHLRLPGHRDGLRVDLLQRWLYKIPTEKAAKSKKKGASGRLRCFGRALVQAAALVFRRGVLLRTALGHTDNVTAEEVLSARDEIAQLKARLAEAEQARAAEQQRAEREAADKCKAQDAHRKLKERGQEQRKAAKATAAKGRTEALAKQLARSNKRIKEAKARMAADARAAADKATAGQVAELKKRVAAARKRARAKESAAKESNRYLKRAKKAEGVLKELQSTLEEESEEEPEEEEPGSDDDEQAGGSSRRDARGRHKALPQHLRVLIWAQLSRHVPPSAIHANVSDAIGALTQEDEVTLPGDRDIIKMRGELTIASEAIAAFRVALSKRIISFGWDESTKFGLGLLSSNTQIETHEGEVVDVVMRGAALTAGGKAEAVAWAIDHKIFRHARRLLEEWRTAHEQKFGAGSWCADGGPSPGSLGLNRLTELTTLMSDTCNSARACKRLVADAAMAALKAEVGEEEWDKLTEEERAERGKVYIGECQAHLRNIIINAMYIKATESLKEKLQDSLAEFSHFDRMSVDGNDLIRAIFKELHEGGEYAKGKGREFWAWVKTNHPEVYVMHFVCANGTRQDIAFDGAVPIFMNRKIILEFLKSLVVPGSDNKLELFLARVLSCNEITALLRVNTLWKYIFSEPARWLSGKASKDLKDWSLDSSSDVLDLIEKAMVEIANDGHTLLDPSFDPFASIAAKQPAFREWREGLMQYTAKAPDGSLHRVHVSVLSEARSPAEGGNAQATETVVKLAEEMATAALKAMRDPRRAICSLLTSQDSERAVGKDDAKHKDTAGAHVTNCRVESNFGCIDIVMRMFRYATVENISGMAQQMRNKDFERPKKVDTGRGRKRKETPEPERDGFFYSGLNSRLQDSLVEYSRRATAPARVAGRSALKAHDDEKLARREERLETLLNKAVEHYAYALELFNAWQAQRATSKAQVAKALKDANGRPKPEAQQLEYLRLQIEMRTLGLGWTQYSTRWSSKADENIGTVAHLTALLEETILEEKARARFTGERGLPTEPAPPHHQARDIGQLGTADADAISIAHSSVFDTEQLRAKAQQERQRRIESGIADAVERMQPHEAPAFDSKLIGKRLEVLWKYHEKLADGSTQPHLIWATGRVTRIADGLTNKRSSRARKILPAGALLWAWDADPEFGERAGEQWLILLPKKWNGQQVYSWRFDPRELGAQQRAKGAQKQGLAADKGQQEDSDA